MHVSYICVALKPDPHILSIVVFQAHMEAVHADWKEYLNLLICEENHLKHMDEYHKVRNRTNEHLQRFKAQQNRQSSSVCWCVCVQYHKEARDTQDLLKRLDKELDQKYNPEFKDVYQMEGMIGEIDVSISFLVHVKLLIPPTPSTALKIMLPVRACVCTGSSQGHGTL